MERGPAVGVGLAVTLSLLSPVSLSVSLPPLRQYQGIEDTLGLTQPDKGGRRVAKCCSNNPLWETETCNAYHVTMFPLLLRRNRAVRHREGQEGHVRAPVPGSEDIVSLYRIRVPEVVMNRSQQVRVFSATFDEEPVGFFINRSCQLSHHRLDRVRVVQRSLCA